jgi:ABC-type lipoprotein release transport system permease subunit
MPYETLIGWRYLYRKPRAHRRLIWFFLLTFVGVAVISALFWVRTSQPPPASVIIFTLGIVGAIVCAVVNVFSLFVSVSVFGVMLGVTALTIMLAVTCGFKSAFQD